MKKFSSFILVLLFTLAISLPVLSQDIAPKSDPVGPVNTELDGPGLPTTEAFITVLPGNNSTSGNGRAPQGSRRFINTKYIITGAEMTTSGFAGQVYSVGWRWNVPFPPAAAPPQSQSTATTGNLRVYLKDTVGTALTFGGTFIDTMGVGYTKVIDGTISIPTGLSEINIDVPVGGPGTGAYTPTPGMGVLMIFVYKTTTATLATPLGAPICFCTNVGTGTKLLTFQSQTVGGSTGAASVFRPETRFGDSPIPPCDVGPIANLSPAGVVPSCPATTMAPKTLVRNLGTADQTGIQVDYVITGPVNYSSSRTIDLLAQESKVVVFDSTFTPNADGAYNVTISTSLVCDTTLSNDTLYSSFSASNPSAGGGAASNCNYFFANSTACSPDGPEFLLEDTTGSTSLTVDGVNVMPAIFNGNLDDGHWKLGNILAAGDKFRFCGVDYDSFFVSTNGIIALTLVGNTNAQVNSFTTTNIPAVGTVKPAIFPFWKDFNYSVAVVTSKRLSYKVVPGKLIITHDRAPNFGATLADDYASFQIILEIVSAPVADGDIKVQYDEPGTGATFLAKYFGFTLAAHTAGLQDATGTLGIQYRRATGVGAAAVIASGPLYSSSVAVLYSACPFPGTPSITITDTNTVNPVNCGGNLIIPGSNGSHQFTVTATGDSPAEIITLSEIDSLSPSGCKIIDISPPLPITQASPIVVTVTVTRVSGALCGGLITFNVRDHCVPFNDANCRIGIDNPLPVELSSFVSVINGRDVTLNWTTATESNNSGFDVERSIVNGGWSKVGNVSGNGTTNAPHNYSFTDRALSSGKYNYRLKQIDFNGNFEYFNLSNEVNVGTPDKFDLSQNYPNPFNPSTKINYDLPFDGKVSIKLFDMSGKEVATLVNEVKTAGYHTIDFNAANLSSGVYFYRLSAEVNGNNFVATKKMMLLK